jgi:hypothetical protein
MAQHLEIKWSLFSNQVPLQKDKIAIVSFTYLQKKMHLTKRNGCLWIRSCLILTTFTNQKDIVQNKEI